MNTSAHQAPLVHLRRGGVSFVLELAWPVPRVVHWGSDLGNLGVDALEGLRLTSIPSVTHSSTDLPRHLSIVPTEADAWSGTPGIEGWLSPSGRAALRFELKDVAVADEHSVSVRLEEREARLELQLDYAMDDSGVLSVGGELAFRADAEDHRQLDLSGVTVLLPLPERASELVDFTGKWSRERSPQRRSIQHGTILHQSRRGRPSLDSPYLYLAGTKGFDFRHGEIWAAHVAWSGNQRYLVEQLPEGAGAFRSVLGGGELLLPGEVVVRKDVGYRIPTVFFAWSDEGMDGIAARFHTLLRSRPNHPASPRPLVLNTWEAVYFDHDLPKLLELVDRAAEVGVERVVLDDGWFLGRRHDRTGLGDWFVDPSVWPDGLAPFVERVRRHGMQFGLWFEPEMVNLTSRIAIDHPEWILAPSAGAGPAMRHQHVLNLAHQDAWEYLLDRLDRLVSEYTIDYIKWDHNRELHEASRRDAGDRAGVHAQTEALYALLDELKRLHPLLEIESCASGGGRVDLGILSRTDRVWASDCNDPVERQQIQRWTAQLIPLELIGAHVGDAQSHTTKRTTDLSFRLATALFGHSGIEEDLTSLAADELAALQSWASLYRELRPLLHSGRLVRGDLVDDQALLTGVVSQDMAHAVFSWARLGTSADTQSGRVPLPGLDPLARYRVTVRTEIGAPVLHEAAPEWFAAAQAGGVLLDGSVLARAGIPLPTLQPQQAILLELIAEAAK